LLSDEDLFWDGRESAMTQLIGRYERPLYRFIFQMVGDAHLAEDLFQETFLRLHHARATFVQGAPLKPYIFRVALHAIYDFRKRKSRRKIRVSLEAQQPGASDGESTQVKLGDVLPGSSGDPSSDSEQREKEALVRRAVEALPEAEREVVLLRIFEGLSFAHIAEITRVPLATAKSRMIYALRRLRPVLEARIQQDGV